MAIEHEYLTVSHPAGKYRVVVGYQLLESIREQIGDPAGVALITDDNVGPLYAARLADHFDQVVTITLPAGEQSKTLATVAGIYEQMLAAGLDRQATVVALGGGVVNDIAGFAAATYMRGVRFVTCPTSLLAMVDASVGGKTGVDLPQGKNLVGAFKQPEVVIADLGTLATLPPEEFAAGMAELIKHGLLSAPSILTEIKLRDWSALARLGEEAKPDLQGRWQALVLEGIQVKRDIVEGDPFEGGRRAVLNLGHTFAHAIEQVSRYEVGHGQAVAMGLVCAAHLSAALGHVDGDLQRLVEAILRHAGLPTRIPAGFEAAEILGAMSADKKKAAGRLRFILLKGIGLPFVTAEVPREAVLNTIRELTADS